jgi:hypothetical protein
VPEASTDAGGCVADQAVDEGVDLVLDERGEPDRRLPAVAELDQIGTGEAQEDDRRAGHGVREAGEHLQESRLSPVEVLDQDNERTLARLCDEERSDRPRSLGSRRDRVRYAEKLRERRGDCAPVPRVGEAGLDTRPRFRGRVLVPDSRRLANDVADRPVGDAFTVRQTAAVKHGHAAEDPHEELVGKARLADSGLSHDGHQAAPRGRRCLLELLLEPCEVFLPADERRSGLSWRRPDSAGIEKTERA